MTIVVNIYKEKYDQYIGRAGRGKDGYFGNPFLNGTREQNIVDFENYFYNRLETDTGFKLRIHSLANLRLGCFCKPKNCHGDVIAKYLNYLAQ